MAASGLNELREKFCLHYFATGNAAESYRKAGYKSKSENAVCANSSRLIRSDKVQGRLKELRMEQEKRIEVTADWVVQGLAHEATLEGEGASHAARVSAYKTLAQIKGMIVNKAEVTGKDGGPIEYIEIAGEGGAR